MSTEKPQVLPALSWSPDFQIEEWTWNHQSQARRLRLPRAPALGLLPSPRNRAPRAPQSLASGSHTQCRVSSCAAMHPRAGVASADASAPGSHRSGHGGFGFVWDPGDPVAQQCKRRSSGAVDQRRRHRVHCAGSQPSRRPRKWPMFRIHQGAVGPALLALPLLRSDFLASPFPLGFPAVLPAEAWGWDCGSPGPAVVYASRTLESCYLIPFSRFSRYCNKGSALGLLALWRGTSTQADQTF